MNIQTLDALIQLRYIRDSFSDTQVQDIISIWLKRGNRRINLNYITVAQPKMHVQSEQYVSNV